MVDAVDAGGAAQEGGVGAEEPDGAGSEDGYGVADYEAREVEAGPGCGPDVGYEEEVEV